MTMVMRCFHDNGDVDHNFDLEQCHCPGHGGDDVYMTMDDDNNFYF